MWLNENTMKWSFSFVLSSSVHLNLSEGLQLMKESIELDKEVEDISIFLSL